MKNRIAKIVLYSSFIIIPFLVVISIYGVGQGDKEKKVPEISKEIKLELRNKILEAENINYQILDLTKKRDELISQVNRQVDDLMLQYKLDKKNYGLDL